jgi:(hydroxyamino)benzene mutase
MSSISALLCFTGMLLFLLGLLVGFGIPIFPSPRIGVSAHATGVQSGTLLLVIGLMWSHVRLSPAWSLTIAHALWISLYLLFLGLTLGAIWVTGRNLPIAGSHEPALPWQERTVQILLAAGGIGSTAAVFTMLVQWHWVEASPR